MLKFIVMQYKDVMTVVDNKGKAPNPSTDNQRDTNVNSKIKPNNKRIDICYKQLFWYIGELHTGNNWSKMAKKTKDWQMGDSENRK